jgi:hypothetical protein
MHLIIMIWELDILISGYKCLILVLRYYASPYLQVGLPCVVSYCMMGPHYQRIQLALSSFMSNYFNNPQKLLNE